MSFRLRVHYHLSALQPQAGYANHAGVNDGIPLNQRLGRPAISVIGSHYSDSHRYYKLASRSGRKLSGVWQYHDVQRLSMQCATRAR